MMTRICNKCKQELELDMFWKLPTGKARHYCKKCMYTKNSARRKSKGYDKVQQVKRLYGLSLDDYKIILDAVDVCPICENKMGTKDTPCNKRWKVLDHCHNSDKVRGVICNKCNAALGLTDDNVTTLVNMVNYLLETEEK